MKHKYLRELFPDGDLPFPYGEEDYHDFDERDTFNLNGVLIAWLYERLRYFHDDPHVCVDLTFHKFDIDGEELTQLQCIERMIEDCKTILLYDCSVFDDYKEENEYFESIVDPAKNDLLMVLSKVYWAMWW